MKRRLRRGGCLAWRQTAFTVEVDVPTCRAIARADMPVGSRSSICCFFAALIGRQAVLRMLRAAVVSLASDVGATLVVLDSGATSPAMRRSRKASRGSQLFGLMLPRCTKDVAITGFHPAAAPTGTVQSAISPRLSLALRCELLEGISHVGSHLGALDVVAHGDAGIVAEHA